MYLYLYRGTQKHELFIVAKVYNAHFYVIHCFIALLTKKKIVIGHAKKNISNSVKQALLEFKKYRILLLRKGKYN